MSGRRVFGVPLIVVAFVNAILTLYMGKPVFAALWALTLIVASIHTVIDWNKPPQEVSANPLRTQLMFGALLLGVVALLWFSRGMS